MTEAQVIQVDENDNVIGFKPKQEAHQTGVLHRAVSILVFNSNGDWLLQRRALSKYHSGGLWSNTCCSHPYPNEEVDAAASRRLVEEMGLFCNLRKMLTFTYKAELDNNLIEHEFDHVFYGYTEDPPQVNPEEVQDWKWISGETLKKELLLYPERYTAWFKILYPMVIENWRLIK